MILYNWKKIYKKCGGKVRDITLITKEVIYEKKLPETTKDPIYKYYDIDFSGDSFLLNPKDLFENANQYTQKEIAMYIALASYRKLADYIAFNTTSLELLHSPVDLTKLNDNRLLHVENSVLYFKYEEVFFTDKTRKNNHGNII